MSDEAKRVYGSTALLVGCAAFLHYVVFQGRETSDPQAMSQYTIIMLVVFVIAFLYFFGFKLSNFIDALTRERGAKPAVRSDWEIEIEQRMHHKYPDLKIVTNDRSIVPNRNGRGYLEIDLWLPEIRLAIEANGESYHDHDGYRQDLMNGTCHTEERYKEVYCQDHDISFLHVWSSQDREEIDDAIAEAVSRAYDDYLYDY